MPAIADEDVQKVRAATDIVTLFQDRYILTQRGRDFWCCCPFHEEKSPSCKIDPATQQFYCFGCHEHGDVFSFVMKTEDVGFPDAVRRLAERAGIEIKEEGGKGVSRSYKERLRGVCAETVAFYHTQLMRGKSEGAAAARAYLGGRDLGGSVPKTWQLGYAPGKTMLLRHLRSKGYSVKEMIDANVVVAREGATPRDRFYERIMFPIFDETGQPIAFGGRVIGKGEPKYLNSQDTPLFHKGNVLFGLDKAKAQMTATGTAIVVEGYTDVIALHEAGVANVVATLGTALTTAHLRSIGRHAVKTVVYLFDGDEAGQRATDRALQFIDSSMTPEAGKTRVELLACTLPDNLDPADFIAQRGPDALREQIAGAKPLLLFGIERHIARYDTESAEGRTAAFSDALALLAPIKDSLLAKDYAVRIAGMLRMRENDAIERLSQLSPPPRRTYANQQQPQAAQQPQGPRISLTKAERNRRKFETELIGVAAHNPALALEFAAPIAAIQWHTQPHARAADALLACIADNPTAASSDVSAAIVAAEPSASRMLVQGTDARTNPATYIAYVCEELAIGDLTDEIETYRGQLATPEQLSADEFEMLFQTVSSLQKDLARRKEAHAKAAL